MSGRGMGPIFPATGPQAGFLILLVAILFGGPIIIVLLDIRCRTLAEGEVSDE